MKKECVKFNWKGRKFSVDVNIVPWYYEGIGLMFSRKERARNLLFEFKRDINLAIHSIFVFYSFLAIWLDKSGKCVDIKVIRPFRKSVLPRGGKFSRLIEVPINLRNKEFVSSILSTVN